MQQTRIAIAETWGDGALLSPISLVPSHRRYLTSLKGEGLNCLVLAAQNSKHSLIDSCARLMSLLVEEHMNVFNMNGHLL